LGLLVKESLGTEDKRRNSTTEERQTRTHWMTIRAVWVFWLLHFEVVKLKDINEVKLYSAISKMTNRRAAENWKMQAD
jgi:hypothetical protein